MKKVIMFSASWCQPCKKAKPVFEDLKEKMQDVEFLLIDIDEDDETASKYNILSVPTFVLEQDSHEVARRTGAASEDTLKKFITQ